MLKIEHMTDDDLNEVVAIEKRSFVVPKNESIFRHDENKYLVAKNGGRIVGYIGLEKIEGETHIINMAVDPKHRRQGIGGQLIEKVLNDRDIFFLEVRASNDVAQKLYEKYGFKNVGVRKNYYSDNGEDACIMRREPK
jgi:ribosomal-protein-alanine N-acetyltransferase